MRATLAGVLSLCLLAGLAGPASAADKGLSVAGPARAVSADSCGRVTVHVPRLNAPRFKTGGINSLWAAAQRRLQQPGLAISGSRTVLDVASTGDVSCAEATRAMRHAFEHPGEAWNAEAGGGGLLGRPSGWSCRFQGVRMDPSQRVPRNVWSDKDPDALCVGGSGSSVTANVTSLTPGREPPGNGGGSGTPVLSQTGNLFKGLGLGAWDDATALYRGLTNPAETAKQVWSATANHWGQVWGQTRQRWNDGERLGAVGGLLWDGIAKPLGGMIVDNKVKREWKTGNQFGAVGRSIWNVGSLFIPGGAAVKVAAKLGRIAKAAGKAARVAKRAAKRGDVAAAKQAADKAERQAREATRRARQQGCKLGSIGLLSIVPPALSPATPAVATAPVSNSLAAVLPSVGALPSASDGCHDARRARRAAESAREAADSAAFKQLLNEPEALRGSSPDAIGDLMPEHWNKLPSKRGGGTRYNDPDNVGSQVRIMPGNPNDVNPVKRGPYMRVTKNGRKSPPIPLSGNPTLN